MLVAEIQKWSNTQNTEFDFEKLDQIIDEKISDFEEKEQLNDGPTEDSFFVSRVMKMIHAYR